MNDLISDLSSLVQKIAIVSFVCFVATATVFFGAWASDPPDEKVASFHTGIV